MKKHFFTHITICLILLFNSAHSSYAANRYWVGSILNGWSNSTNWSATSGGSGGAGAPGSSDTAIFNGGGLIDCIADANITVASLHMKGSYTKTLSQLIYNITVTQNAVYSSGIFLGGVGTMNFKNLTVNGGVFISTSGLINISGNLTLDAVAFVQTLGTINFCGTSSQTITIVNPIGVIGFFNMQVNNSGAGIILGNNLQVSNQLTMVQGNINLNTHTLLLGLISGTGVLSYTSGFMTGTGTFARWFPITTAILNFSIGDTRGLFPMGEGTDSRKVWVGANIGVITIAGVISVSHTDMDAITNITPFSDGGLTVNRYNNTSWEINQNGIGLALGISSTGLEIRIEGQGLKGVTDYTRLRMIRSTDAIGNFVASTGSNALPQVNRTGLTLLDNTFHFGSSSSFNALPVTLLDFTAKKVQHHVVLDWTGTTDANSSHFIVERSEDGKAFMPVGTVKCQQGAELAKYTLNDENPLGATAYYRLKQIDVNGAYDYSKMISVAHISTANQPVLYPNPVKGELNITSEADATVLKLYDMKGKLLMQEDINTYSNIKVDHLDAGLYMVHLFDASNNLLYTHKIVKQ